jgi:hypothetical protein
VTTKLEVFCLVNYTHASTPDLAEDAVMGNRLPHGLGGRRHWLDMLGVDQGKVNRSPLSLLIRDFFTRLQTLTSLRTS